MYVETRSHKGKRKGVVLHFSDPKNTSGLFSPTYFFVVLSRSPLVLTYSTVLSLLILLRDLKMVGCFNRLNSLRWI